jgi:hypothetical protein
MNNYTIEQQKMLAEFLGKKVLIEKDVYYKDGKYFINYSMKMSGGGLSIPTDRKPKKKQSYRQ